MKRVLLLLPTAGYRNDDFVAAARTLGVEILAAADYCHRLAPSWGLAVSSAPAAWLAQVGRLAQAARCRTPQSAFPRPTSRRALAG